MQAIKDLKEIVKNAGCSYISDVKTYAEQQERYYGVLKLLESIEQIRNEAIDKFAEAICVKANEEATIAIFPDGIRADVVTSDYIAELAFDIADEMKRGGNNGKEKLL